MTTIRKFLASRYFLWILLYLPFASLAWGFTTGEIYYGEMLHASGEFSARLLMVALAATPLRLLFPTRAWTRWLLANRRYFGVASFAYALLHTLVYLDKQETFSVIFEDALGLEMWTAWLALLIFALLALTSNDRSVRALKTAWKRLHRWVYLAALLAFLHWIFIAFDFVPGLVHLLILLAIESLRLVKWRRQTAV